jgi:potassium-transporting ATPase KdpC subunit
MLMIRTTLLLFLLLSAITGLAYPLLLTGTAQILFPFQANGSVLIHNKRAVGSVWLAQPFTAEHYFWSRPSATAPQPYNGAASSGSNLASGNPVLIQAIEARVAALHAADPGNIAPIPVDLVTASASGLDPHISIAAARYQLPRVARARGISETLLQRKLAAHTEPRLLGVLGEPGVNVLLLNRALDLEHAH